MSVRRLASAVRVCSEALSRGDPLLGIDLGTTSPTTTQRQHERAELFQSAAISHGNRYLSVTARSASLATPVTRSVVRKEGECARIMYIKTETLYSRGLAYPGIV